MSSNDPQDQAESVDEDSVGGEGSAVTSDEVEVDFPPDRPHALPFADADVTDESVADRVLQEQPEVWEQAEPDDPDQDTAADERLEQIIDVTDQR
jgi:hypothetical protein